MDKIKDIIKDLCVHFICILDDMKISGEITEAEFKKLIEKKIEFLQKQK